jgi:uncharacterized protein (DUF302 family)
MSLAFAAPAGAFETRENPAFWRHQVQGDFHVLVQHLKHGLETRNFIITGEDNLALGLENNRHLFPPGQWNTIGFENAVAIHFCSLILNQEVFNTSMDWGILCPFKVFVYNMKASPQDITIIALRVTHLLRQDPHPRAREMARKIDARVLDALREALAWPH